MKKAIALTVIMGASLLLAQNKEVDSPDFALSGGNELIKLAEDNVLVFRENGTLKVTGSGYVEVLAVAAAVVVVMRKAHMEPVAVVRVV